MKILMVCTGNICRSPMAEGIARFLLQAAGRDDISVDSAATLPYHTGKAPDPRACRVMRAHNMPIDDLRARPFTVEDFYAFDLILVADHEHYHYLTARSPQDEHCAEVAYMLDTLPDDPGADLPDPYYGDEADFESTFALLDAALRARFAALR